MGLWSAYFFVKLLLYALGYLDFSPWLNLAFAIFTALVPSNSRQRFAKNLIAVPVGILLLYHDSWLPPITEAFSQLQNLRAFSAPYLWEIVGRIISWRLLAELALLLGVYAVARRKLRMSTFVFIGILAVTVVPHGHLWTLKDGSPIAAATSPPAAQSMDTRNMRPEALEARLEQFYLEQKKIQVRFARPATEDSAYDILILHICSLSWDDLHTLQLAPDALFAHFDVVLTNFSSGASYSGPAAIRLLRGACGATPESKLYEPPARECLVMDGLQRAGFEPHWLMNHDGRFGNFFSDVRDRGGVSAALESNVGAALGGQTIDGTPYYTDYSVLSRWWAKRQENPAARVALYYNSISLHDGNRVSGPARNDSAYGARFARFSSDIARFMDDLRSSGRHVIVVLVAEHGAALAGDRRQISGLREIPTAAIAHVPVAIALINAPQSGQTAMQQQIDIPAGYPAVNELLSRLIADSPFDKSSLSLGAYTTALPQTDFVAENNATTVLEIGGHDMMRSPDGEWLNLD